MAVAVTALGWSRDQRVERARTEVWEAEGARVGQEVRLLMELPSRIRESSGLAVSRVNPGLFWTHNDSGGDAVLYGLWPERGAVHELRMRGAPARDWEDLDEGPCPEDPAHRCLFAGDIGDNLGRRDHISVLVVREPEFGGEARDMDVSWRMARLQYPGGPRDAEALIVSDDGRMRIVTKGREGEHGVYGASTAELPWDEDSVMELNYEGRIPLAPMAWLGRVVTAGADTPEGVALRTYTEVHFFEHEEGAWVRGAAPCVVATLPPTGEGLDVDPDGTVFLSSEAARGAPGRLESAVCPGV